MSLLVATGIILLDTWKEGVPFSTGSETWEYRPWSNGAAKQIGDEFIHGYFDAKSLDLQRHVRFYYQPVMLRVEFKLWIKDTWQPSGGLETRFGDQVGGNIRVLEMFKIFCCDGFTANMECHIEERIKGLSRYEKEELTD